MIKEILIHYNRLDAKISKHILEAIEKYSFRKKSDKFANQLDFTAKETDIKIMQ